MRISLFLELALRLLYMYIYSYLCYINILLNFTKWNGLREKEKLKTQHLIEISFGLHVFTAYQI